MLTLCGRLSLFTISSASPKLIRTFSGANRLSFWPMVFNCEGIDRVAFHAQTGFALDGIADRLSQVIELGLLADDGRWVRLTRAGKYVADGVIERLL